MEEEEYGTAEEEGKETFKEKVRRLKEKAKDTYKNRYGIPNDYRQKTESISHEIKEEKDKDTYLAKRKELSQYRYEHSPIGRLSSAAGRTFKPQKVRKIAGAFRDEFSVSPALSGYGRKPKKVRSYKPSSEFVDFLGTGSAGVGKKKKQERLNPELRKLMGI